MKKHLETIFGVLRSALLAIVTVALLFGPTSAMAATNTATWNISGVVQPDATFDLVSFNAGNITLTKTAFLVADGSELTDGATVPSGTPVDFMIFINNKNTAAVNNINISDDLVTAPAGFTYTANSLRFSTTAECTLQACDQGERAALYAAAVAPNTYTDATGDDEASVVAGVVTAGLNGTTNTQLNVAAQTAYALVFTATVD